MKALPLIAIISLFSPASYSQTKNLAPLLDTLNGSLGKIPVDCNDPSQTPECKQVSDQYCEKLSAHEGNFDSMKLGKSAKSSLSEIDKRDLTTLVDGVKFLSPELAILKPGLKKLADALASESDTQAWYKKLGEVRKEISGQIDALAAKNAKANLSKKTKSPTQADKDFELFRERGRLMDLITEAKFKANPRWAKIEEVFNKVKSSMISEVQNMDLTNEEVTIRTNKIIETTLSYPSGMKTIGPLGELVNKDCRSNMLNALYNVATRSLTICAGLVNGVESESSLYMVMAHELAHSFNYIRLGSLQRSPIDHYVQAIIETNGNIPCDQWLDLRGAFIGFAPGPYCDQSKYTGLLKCLMKDNQLPHAKSISDAQRDFEEYYQKMDLCSLADTKSGLVYKNPKELIDRLYPKLFTREPTGYAGSIPKDLAALSIDPYVMAQEMKCRPQVKCEDTLQELLRTRAPSPLPADAPCLRDAERTVENESDWYAQKIVRSFIASRKGIRERRELAASTMAILCDYTYFERPELKTLITELQQELRKKSGDVHAEDSDRRNSFMTSEMADLLSCVNSPTTPHTGTHSYQGCKL